MTKLMTATALALAFALGSCSSNTPETDKPQEDALPEVNWDRYPSDLQRIIDKAANKGNCELLQDTFDVQQDAELLDYIDAQLQNAGCYD